MSAEQQRQSSFVPTAGSCCARTEGGGGGPEWKNLRAIDRCHRPAKLPADDGLERNQVPIAATDRLSHRIIIIIIIHHTHTPACSMSASADRHDPGRGHGHSNSNALSPLKVGAFTGMPFFASLAMPSSPSPVL